MDALELQYGLPAAFFLAKPTLSVDYTSCLGSGASARVYKGALARDGGSIDVACKLIQAPGGVAANDAAIQLAMDEAKGLDCVGMLLGVLISGNRTAAGENLVILVMRLGKPVSGLLDTARLNEGSTIPPAEAACLIADRIRSDRTAVGNRIPSFGIARLHLAAKIADCVSTLHERRRLHRDIKPDNVVVLPDGSVSLIDFWPRAMGTPGFAAPELRDSVSAPHSQSTDCFALGVTVFEVLTVRRESARRAAPDAATGTREREHAAAVAAPPWDHDSTDSWIPERVRRAVGNAWCGVTAAALKRLSAGGLRDALMSDIAGFRTLAEPYDCGGGGAAHSPMLPLPDYVSRRLAHARYVMSAADDELDALFWPSASSASAAPASIAIAADEASAAGLAVSTSDATGSSPSVVEFDNSSHLRASSMHHCGVFVSRVVALSGMGGVGKTERSARYASASRAKGRYPGGIYWIRMRSFDADLLDAVVVSAGLIAYRDCMIRAELLRALKSFLIVAPPWLLVLDNADLPTELCDAESLLLLSASDAAARGHVLLTSRIGKAALLPKLRGLPNFSAVDALPLGDVDAAALLLICAIDDSRLSPQNAGVAAKQVISWIRERPETPCALRYPFASALLSRHLPDMVARGATAEAGVAALDPDSVGFAEAQAVGELVGHRCLGGLPLALVQAGALVLGRPVDGFCGLLRKFNESRLFKFVRGAPPPEPDLAEQLQKYAPGLEGFALLLTEALGMNALRDVAALSEQDFVVPALSSGGFKVVQRRRLQAAARMWVADSDAAAAVEKDDDAHYGTIARLLHISLQDGMTSEARRALLVLSYAAPDEIPAEKLLFFAEVDDAAITAVADPARRLALETAIDELVNLSLVMRSQRGLVRMHRLLQLVVRDYDFGRDGPSRHAAAAGELVKGLARCTSFIRDTTRDADVLGVWLPHVSEVCQPSGIVSRIIVKPSRFWSMCLSHLSLFLRIIGRYVDALGLAEAALEMQLSFRPDDPLLVANALNDVASCCYILGRHGMALALGERALASLPVGHPLYATYLGNVASYLSGLGRHAESISLSEQTLAWRRAARPVNHVDIATNLCNIANCWNHLGFHDKALANGIEALNLLPEDHPFAAYVITGIAGSLNKLGRYKDALIRGEKALAMQRSTRREGHPDIALCLCTNARILNHLGRYDEAIAHGNEALSILTVSFPDGHADVIVCLVNKADCLNHKGEYTEALKHCNQALNMLHDLLPRDHSSIAAVLATGAGSLFHLGRLDEALAWFEEALQSRRIALPAGHPEIVYNIWQCVLCLNLSRRSHDAFTRVDAALLEAVQACADPGCDRTTGSVGRVNSVLRRCAGCRLAAYCSDACQKVHWKVHKHFCVTVAENLATLAESYSEATPTWARLSALLVRPRRRQ